MKMFPALLPLLLFFHCSERPSGPMDEGSGRPPNVLFIAVDDLRPELGAYGQDFIHSPNFDALAADATLFQRAYCSVPVCGASRASLLTGLHPTPTRFVDYGARVEEEAPGRPTLPGHLKASGYHTASVGKIFHHPDDALGSWDEPPVRPDYPNTLSQQELWRDYQSPENAGTKVRDLPLGAAGPAWEAADVADTVYYDGKTTALALSRLEELARNDEPFFFGVGYIRPHLPFNAPKRYWDLYDPASLDLASNPYQPHGAPAAAQHNFGELRSYTNIANDASPVPDEQARQLRHGYYANVSFIDAQIGRLISQLKTLGLYDNTVIVVWGDHGWNLGEHALWAKHSLLQNALRTALIIKPAGARPGTKTSSLASLVDLFPTVCDLTGVAPPQGLDGRSLAPIIDDPAAEVQDAVFARWQNGESIKTDSFLYTEYYSEEGEPVSSMLYEHYSDPEENENVEGSASYRVVVERLGERLDDWMKRR